MKTHITSETLIFRFLFGTYDTEGFSSFTEHREKTFESFDTFYDTVESLLSSYGQDDNGVAVDKAEATTVFEMPDVKTIKEWFFVWSEDFFLCADCKCIEHKDKGTDFGSGLVFCETCADEMRDETKNGGDL